MKLEVLKVDDDGVCELELDEEAKTYLITRGFNAIIKDYLTKKEKTMRDQILDAVRKHAEGNIAVHKTNVEVYLNNPAGIGEHSDITEAVLAEMEKIAHWQDVLETTYEFE